MKIQVRLPGGPPRRWHLELLQRISALPDTQVSAHRPNRRNGPSRREPIEAVLALERVLHPSRTGLGEHVDAELLDGWTAAVPGAVDVQLDLSDVPGDRCWRLTFDGVPGEAAGVDALRRGRPPVVTVVTADGRVLAEGRPGSETPGVLALAYDDLLAGCISLLMKSIEGLPSTPPAPLELDGREPGGLSRHVVGQLVGTVMHRTYRAFYRAPHWRVGWRFVDGPGLLDRPDHQPSDWRVLPDDGLRFYADPFPFVHEGQEFLFVEDFEHRLGRGIISVVPFDERGPAHTPRPVLSHEVHLSYPQVLEDGGEVWMVPETNEARTIELYRAESFPDRWKLETTLVEGLAASDATLFQHEGSWWMTATVRSGGSYSDALYLWSAERLTGPWRPHRNNPVLIDISSARPAGRVENSGGRLLRPVQDGRFGYGKALAVAEITALSADEFAQRVIGRLQPGTWWPGRRLHTLNRAGRLETIDGSAMAPRYWSRGTRSRG